jgi:hypothetical protein
VIELVRAGGERIPELEPLWFEVAFLEMLGRP